MVSRSRCLHQVVCVGVLVGILGVGCEERATAQAPPPPEVRVVLAEMQRSPNLVEVPGRLQAVRAAEVRARVDGVVQRRVYEEGTDVREGQVLFRIDPRELQAQLSAVKALLARAEAAEANAALEVERFRDVVGQVISRQAYEETVARHRTAQADVAQARAQVEAAQLKVNYATVTAPISGRAGRAEVTEGALVSAAAATLLTRIEQIDPIYMNFSQSSSEVLAIRRDIAAGTLVLPELRRVVVHLTLEDGTEYPLPGLLNFFDLRIDEATGTSAFRAEFPNPKRVLLPGQFVRARIEAGVRSSVFLIPQRAVVITPQGANVLVVNAEDTVESRPVSLGDLEAGSWSVLGGLKERDRVIVDGIQKAQPGRKVRVTHTAPPASAGQSTTIDSARAETGPTSGADGGAPRPTTSAATPAAAAPAASAQP